MPLVRDDNIVQATSPQNYNIHEYDMRPLFVTKNTPDLDHETLHPGDWGGWGTWARSIITTIVNHLLVKVGTCWQNSVSPVSADIHRSCHDHMSHRVPLSRVSSPPGNFSSIQGPSPLKVFGHVPTSIITMPIAHAHTCQDPRGFQTRNDEFYCLPYYWLVLPYTALSVLKTELTREYWWSETLFGPKHFQLRYRSSWFLIPALHHINDVWVS